jgi:hypothetical protein
MLTRERATPARPTWQYYIEVADLGATVERAKAKGATVVSGPTEVQGAARTAQLVDPQGAAFALHEASTYS